MISKRGLLILSGLLWTVAGYNVLRKGFSALICDHRWWIVLLACAIAGAFLAMFHRVAERYSLRIEQLPGITFPCYRFMNLRGYLLIGFMITLGIVVGHLSGIPTAFYAAFYTGLGTGLSYGALRFFLRAIKHQE